MPDIQPLFLLAESSTDITKDDGSTFKGVNRKQFVDDCQAAGLGPKKTVLIWPTNTGHHQAGKQTLFGKQSGDGLGLLAASLGDKGYPTLGLPTTGMDPVGTAIDDANPAPDMAKAAVADLWKAAGFGYNFYLPTRQKPDGADKNKYFDSSLTGKDNFEPSLWGGEEGTANKHLAKYYLDQIEILRKFIALDKEAKAAAILAKQFDDGAVIPEHLITAYEAGQTALASDEKSGFFAPASQSIKADKLNGSQSLVGSGQRIKIKEVMAGLEFKCTEKGGSQNLSFSKIVGKDKLEFTVSRDKVSASSTQSMSDASKKALAAAMVSAFKAGLPEGQKRYSVNSSDEKLAGFIRTAAHDAGLRTQAELDKESSLHSEEDEEEAHHGLGHG